MTKEKYEHELAIADQDYLDCVNQFYNFWQLRNKEFPMAFMAYLSKSSRKNRLAFDKKTNRWHLIKTAVPIPTYNKI